VVLLNSLHISKGASEAIIENYKGQVGIDEKAYIPASVFDNQNMSLKKITELANALDTNIKN